MSASMLKAVLCGLALALGPAGLLVAQSGAPQPLTVEVANLREDLRLVAQRVGEMAMRIEQLERENAELRAQTAGAKQAYATTTDVAELAADLNRTIKAGDAANREQSAAQIKELGRQTNAAIDSLAKGLATRPTVQTTFSDDYPKEGISYTVQKGDTLAVIARKTGAKLSDIQNANKLSDPSKITVGQTLFIPGAK